MSDIRIDNTKNELRLALLECLKEKSLKEIKVKDIIKAANVSTRTFYQYYSDVNDLVDAVEEEFIEDYRENLTKDRKSLGEVDPNLPLKVQLEKTLNSAKHTISFCFARRDEIEVLLSDNGDIKFYNLLYETSCEEFKKQLTRFNYPQKTLSADEQILVDIHMQVFVHCMMDLVIVLLQYNDHLSPDKVRKHIVHFLHVSPLDKVTEIVRDH